MHQEIYREEREFIGSIIPTTDSDHVIKRLRFEEWYKPFGKNILHDNNFPDIAKGLDDILGDKYWIYKENGDILLNRKALVTKILDLKQLDSNINLLTEYKQYKVACWLGLEKRIRHIFPLLKNKGDDESEKDFITDTLSHYSKIMSFWSHYIHIVDENGKYIKNPNVGILCNLRRLMKDKGLVRINQANLWKYGFECAKQEMCIEGLDFFFTKLKEMKVDERELDKILIDLALYASSGKYSPVHSKIESIVLALDSLGEEKHKILLNKDLATNRFHSIIEKLKKGYLFGYSKHLIQSLAPKGLSHSVYNETIYTIADSISCEADKDLRKMTLDFLMWILGEENFLKHKKTFLNTIGKDDPIMTETLSTLIMSGEIRPFDKILNYATGKKLKKIAKVFSDIELVYCPLYIKNRRDVIAKMLNSDEISKKFFEGMDEFMKINPKFKDDLNNAHEVEELKRIILRSELLENLSITDIASKSFNHNVSSDLSEIKVDASIKNCKVSEI